MTDEPILSVHEEATLAERDLLEDRLYEFNVAATEIDDGRGLAVKIHGADGELIGAAVGHTWGGTCELRQVWVREGYRRQRLGTRLMLAAQAEAVRRRCVQMVLTTHSFQAPGFYQRLGFQRLFELTGYPNGHSQILLRKALLEGSNA